MTDLAAIRSECVEVMAEASEADTMKNYMREVATKMLAALEAAVHTAECPTCGGRSYVVERDVRGEGIRAACEAAGCDHGRVVLGGLLTHLCMERRPSVCGPQWVERARSMEEKT